MKLKYLTTLLLSLLFLGSCSQNENVLESLEQLKIDSPYKNLFEPDNKTLNILSSVNYSNSPTDDKFYSLHNTERGNSPVNKSSNTSLAGFFGRSVTPSELVPTSSIKSTSGNESATYVPQDIYVSLNGSPDLKSLKAGDVVSWNKDENNENGVYLTAVYSPITVQGGQKLLQEPNRKEWAFVMEDTGSYTLKESDLQDVPRNAFIDVKVGRGAIVANTDGTNSFANSYTNAVVTVK